MVESEENSFLDITEFQKMFGHDPGKDKFLIKLAIIGYPGTGKSAFIKKFSDQVLPTEHVPSMNTEITSEMVRVSSSLIVEVFLYEVAGQTQYIDIRNLFVRGIQGIIVMFAHHSLYTFKHIPYLIKFVDDHMTNHVPKLLVGNVFEDQERVISYEQASEMAKKLGIDFIQVDVKRYSRNVDSCIGYFISKLTQG